MPPLVVLALAVLLGAALWPALQPDGASPAAAAALLLGIAAARGRTALLALAAAGLCAGLALPGTLPDPPALHGAWRLRGRVATAAWGTTADVAVTSAARPGEAWRPLEGRVRVRFPGTPPPPGTGVAVDGAARPVGLQRLPGEPDPGWAAALSRVASELNATAALRLGAPPAVPRLDDAHHAGLLRAMLDGERGGIPADEAARLRRTGTWHLVSISGLHIGLGAATAWGLAWVLTRPLAFGWRRGGLKWVCAAAAVAAAFAYASFAGLPLPARRAAWMAAAGAVCAALHRRPGPWELLALAAIGGVWAEPSAPLNPGFQLSFGALAGILLLERRVTRLVPPDAPWLLGWVARALASTLGATAGTLPVVAWRFQDLSPLSPLANLWAVPLIGSVATPALLASQALPGALGALAFRVADGAVGIGLAGLGWLDVEPWHPAVGPAGAVALAAVPLLRRHAIAALGLALLALGLAPAPRDLAVTFLAVGQGDATLVEWPDGRRWLVDGGPPGDALLRTLRRRGIRRLDLVVVSHPHPDHVGGLVPVLRGLRVDRIRVPRLPTAQEADFAALLASTAATVEVGDAPAPRMAVLHPPTGWRAHGGDAVNEESLVVRFGWGARRFLLPGDVEEDAERRLAGAGVRADVLKVPHHGSRGSSSAAFLAAVAPEIAVAMCGRENRYGHPHPEAVGRYRGVRLYRTDRDGNVEVRTDGRDLRVRLGETPEPWRLPGRRVP